MNSEERRAKAAESSRRMIANQQKVEAKFPDRHERVVFARKLAVADPSRVVVDGEFLPWVLDDALGVWISFDGRWSSGGPHQKEHHEMKIEEDMRKSEVWSRIRAVVLERDGHSCVLCGANKQSRLHVHHILKRRDGGTHHYDNLLTVCPRCHSKADRELYDPDWESSVDVDLDGVFD